MDEGEGWQQDAACLGGDPDLWFSHDPSDKEAARRTCRGCPVRTQCLDYALANNPVTGDHGIWGGTDARERRAMRSDPATHDGDTDPDRRRRVQAVGDLEKTARRDPPPALLDVVAYPDDTYTDATGRVVIVVVDRAPRWVVLCDDRVVDRCGSLAAARAAGWVQLHGTDSASKSVAA